MPTWLTLKLGAYIAGAVAILAFVLLAFHWKDTMTARGEKLATICAATRAAADNAKLDCGHVPAQIGELGKSIATLKAALADQNAKVAALGEQTKQQQADSARASQKAQERAGRAEATSARLSASAAHSASSAASGPCEPSKALKEAWR